MDAEDYASIHRAIQALSTRYSAPTLNGSMEAWADFVAEVEEGIDTTHAWEFDNDAAPRDWLHRAWPILTEPVRALRQPELDALDQRFRAATAPIKAFGMSASEVAAHPQWWQCRYPLRVTGDPTDPLPSSWDPPPLHVE
ncbi:hypothetical protein [Streptomyces sp. NPDC091371]|uniref:hypothetical protein n=1 Tax=Streptomyces sp. NPDC091371 TaxID=3155303 RepID=UPI003420BDF1